MKQKYFNSGNAGTFGSGSRSSFIPKHVSDTPGPGRYKGENSTKLINKNIQFSFSRDDKYKNIKSSTPGPGYYLSTNENLIGKHSPMFSIGNSERPSDLMLNTTAKSFHINGNNSNSKRGFTSPGPGQYKLESKIGEGPKFILKGKNNYEPQNLTPGPGAYNSLDKLNTLKKTPNIKMGSSMRDFSFIPKSQIDLPGPGRYKEKSAFDDKIKSWSFSKGPKSDTIKSETPGPGYYIIPDTIGIDLVNQSEPETNPTSINNADQPQSASEAQQEQPESFSSRIYRMVIMFVIFSIISRIINKASGNQNNSTNGSLSLGFENILTDNSTFDINFYLAKSNKPLKYSTVINSYIPILSYQNIPYSSEGNSSFILHKELDYEFDISDLLLLNETNEQEKLKNEKLFLYSDIIINNENNSKFKKLFDEKHSPFFQSLNILKYSENLNQQIKERDMMNDLESGALEHDSINESESESESEKNLNLNSNSTDKDKEYFKNLYYKPEITLYLLSMDHYTDPQTFEEFRILGIPSKVNFMQKKFAPHAYLTDFWTMASDLMLIEKSSNKIENSNSGINSSKLKLKIDFKFLTSFYFKNMRGVEINSEMMETNFHLPGSKDMFVELLKNNSMTYLIIMFTVNILHTVFSVLGFASDVSYYKNLKQLDGVYTKHLFFHIFQMFVAILYVMIEGSHFIVKVELAVGLAVELWKLKKIFKVEFKRKFPFINISYKIEFKQKKSKDYETEAVNLMLKYLFGPVAIFYLSYRIYYYKQKLAGSIIKFLVEYIFFLMNLFGFILLTPQVYLNYKLKSVQHLPFKALTFKFLNTIIDDLYAFAVKTPTLYRIFCFKDDVIFVIFIYQIIKYRNNKRVTSAEEEEGEEESQPQLDEQKKITEQIEEKKENLNNEDVSQENKEKME